MSAKVFKVASFVAIPVTLNTQLGKKMLNTETVNECAKGSAHMQHHMQEEAANLDKIFTEEGALMDPHEVMEMMMNKKGNSLKPYPFEKVMQNCMVFKHHEAIDGLNFNLMWILKHQFQIGGQWILSNSKGPAFEVTSSVNNSSGSPF